MGAVTAPSMSLGRAHPFLFFLVAVSGACCVGLRSMLPLPRCLVAWAKVPCSLGAAAMCASGSASYLGAEAPLPPPVPLAWRRRWPTHAAGRPLAASWGGCRCSTAPAYSCCAAWRTSCPHSPSSRCSCSSMSAATSSLAGYAATGSARLQVRRRLLLWALRPVVCVLLAVQLKLQQLASRLGPC